MNTIEKLGWYGLSRQAIPGVMLGVESIAQPVHDTPKSALSGSADVAVAFRVGEPHRLRGPQIAVLPDQRGRELLGWLHTFSHESFPLSQYCRVLTLADWESLYEDATWNLQRRHCWASLIAGEMLGQAEATPSIAAVPLSWAHGCLSFAIARTVMLYGTSRDILATVGERLEKCDDNRAFQQKPIVARVLSRIWPYAELQLKMTDNPIEVVYALLNAINPSFAELLRRNSNLASASAERRVLGFDEVIQSSKLVRHTLVGQKEAIGPMLAGAAFLVGSGTSHVSLIEPYAKECPEAYVWFGLIAGFAGPNSWDSKWMRLVKGVERLLSASHNITDAPQSDISWVEYDWVSNLNTAVMESFAELPKQNSRSLTVELAPGAACQFRFSGAPASIKDSENSLTKPKAGVPLGASNPGRLTEIELNKVQSLLHQAQTLLGEASKSQLTQQPLFNVPSASPSPRPKTNTKKAPKARGS